MKNNYTFLEKLLDGAEVEWKTLDEIFHLKNGYTPSKGVKEYWENGSIPWFRMEDIRENGRILNTALQKVSESAVKGGKLFPANSIIIATSATIGEHALITIPFLANQRFTVLSLKPEYIDKFNIYFLYHYCFTLDDWCQKNTNMSRFASVDMNGFRRFPIPIPPLPIQTKIVKILDALTALTSELTSELILRRKQYEYYREKLLNIDGMNKVIELGDVGPVRMCKRILKNQTASSGDIPFYKIGTFGKKPDAYISNELFQEYKQKYSYPKKGDILISASGTIGRTVIFDGENSYFQDSNIVWIDNDETLVLNKYLYHFYKIAKWGIAEGGTIQRLYNDNLKKVKISIPPLKEQQRIVSILDKFETLTNSITEGLPLAIEQSQKRYEYYRELLLNFS